MSKLGRFEDLTIFQMARDLCKEVYAITRDGDFHKDSRFVQQIHAAAGSVMDNIAEGFERDGNKEFINFLYIAKGSCGEVRSQLIRASDVGFIDKETATNTTIEEMEQKVLSMKGRATPGVELEALPRLIINVNSIVKNNELATDKVPGFTIKY